MTNELERYEKMLNRIPKVLFLILMNMKLCVSIPENGQWGSWKDSERWNLCLGSRFKYNCTRGEPTNLIREEELVCSQGIFYQTINEVLDGCFDWQNEEGSSTIDQYYNDNRFFPSDKIELAIEEIQSKGDWSTGDSGWSECLLTRKFQRKRMNIYNRRGRQKREFHCPTDNSTIWKEEVRHCCAGSWTEWKVLEECPECGWGIRRTVRICAVPNLALKIETLARKREFLSQWKNTECKRQHCKMVGKNLVKSCDEVCAGNDWWEGTLCTRYGRQAYAGECCIRNYKGLRPSCGMEARTMTDEEKYKTTAMVAIILGAEALLIVITAIIIVLYNIGRMPTMLSSALTACSCHSPRSSMKYRPTTRETMHKQQEIQMVPSARATKKKLRVTARNVQELNRFLDVSKNNTSTSSV
uniref:uncharacterized protein LOC120328988 n=1 Tax=Styela clava TaxID=7725 RepID=UPI001939F26F|nr:uncharacterized protein LOC120328988 [Styela clava]